MTSPQALQTQKEITPGRIINELLTHGWNKTTCGAVVGLIGGVLAPIAGSALTATAWFIGDWRGFHLQRDGTILLFLTIPFLIFGAHCLDLLDAEDHHGPVPPSLENEGVEKGNSNDLGGDKERR
jgi:hypothetical protein